MFADEKGEGEYIDIKLEISNVQFESKGTVFGVVKQRTGCLVMHKGRVVAYRYDSSEKLPVYYFEVTACDVGGMSVSGKALLTLAPDVKGKPRKFTFASNEDVQRFAEAFRKTKSSLLEEVRMCPSE